MSNRYGFEFVATHQHHHRMCKSHLADLWMNMATDFQFHDSNVVAVDTGEVLVADEPIFTENNLNMSDKSWISD